MQGCLLGPGTGPGWLSNQPAAARVSLLSGPRFPWGPLPFPPGTLALFPSACGCLVGMAQLGTSSSGNGCVTSPVEWDRARAWGARKPWALSWLGWGVWSP